MDYSSKFTPNEPSFWRLCDDYICHCDYRLTVSNCVEAKGLYIVNIVDIVWSAIATVTAFGILYFRVFHRNQQIFDTTGRFPRPKPIESMFLCGGLFNLFRLIHSIILVTDVVKNGIFRSFMFEFSWQFGIVALACYLFGVVHTLACSSKTIYMSWVKSQMIVDIACVFMVVLPSVTILPMAIAAGYYAEIGNIGKAILITKAIYYLWLLFTFLLGCMVLLAGRRLLKLLNKHLSMQKNNESEEMKQKIKTGATKVKIIIGIGCTCLWAFSFMVALYATSRHTVMLNSKFTIIFTAMVFFNGPLATCMIELAVLIDFKIFRGLSHLSFGTTLGSKSQNNDNDNVNNSDGDKEYKNSTMNKGDVSQNNTTITSHESDDRFVSANHSETMSVDKWNQFYNKDTTNNNNNYIDSRAFSVPLAHQQHPQQSQLGYSLSAFSSVQ
ncbi:hypothetical protein BJ944DRAFT_279484 [Cunninghamella echinulata]|nr:hypothetical protein BJ944DRAFT_279484 [Cunninghamella echinulata]